MICSVEEKGVASPILKRETGTCLLMKKDTGTRTQKALIMPWAITNRVMPMPLKNPIKQKKIGVSIQSMA